MDIRMVIKCFIQKNEADNLCTFIIYKKNANNRKCIKGKWPRRGDRKNKEEEEEERLKLIKNSGD